MKKDPDKMVRIVEFIDQYYEDYSRIPSMREIAKFIGLSVSNVHAYIVEMSEQNMLEYGGGFRNLKTPKMQKTDNSQMVEIPEVGYVACGEPMLSEENISRYLPFPIWGIDTRHEYFFLRASGNSMKDAGIDSGDMLLIRKQETANEGEIVVALTEDGETTLKRLFFDSYSGKIILHPENEDYQDMYYDYICVQGVVEKIIKDVH